MNNPKISVITPSYNQGQFLEETIQSVLGQCYPNLEYIIIDGGSSDNSIDLIKKYSERITHWVSEPDRGQANAINKGLKMATGDIICWLNSDDMFLPGTLNYIAQQLDIKKAQIIIGNSIHFNTNNEIFWGSNVIKSKQLYKLNIVDYIIQPSSFWTKITLEQVGFLNEKLHYTFDWEWFLRAENNQIEITAVSKYFSIYRIHEGHKSGQKNNNTREREIINIIRVYAGIEIAQIAEKIKPKAEKIRQIKYYIKKFKMKKIEKIILRMLLPSIYFKYKYSLIDSLIKMI